MTILRRWLSRFGSFRRMPAATPAVASAPVGVRSFEPISATVGSRAPSLARRPQVVVLGMLTRHPVGGMVWLTMQYVVGLARLGYDVYYVEAHDGTPKMFLSKGDDGTAAAAEFLDRTFRRFDLPGRWAYHAGHGDRQWYGLSRDAVHRLYREADFILNLHGGTTPQPEHIASGRLVYVGTDPVDREILLRDDDAETVAFFEAHCAFFTWGENYGRPDCLVPFTDRFNMIPSRQPVVLDFWQNDATVPRDLFTTVGSWRQLWREVTLAGENYSWSKHHEFLKFIDLPQRTGCRFELALAGCEPQDQRLLEQHGWMVRDGLSVSKDAEDYRRYVIGSRGEFTVAKDQNVRLRSGWFSDRSATYMAAGRPVVTQDTGFSNILPTGAGLFGFLTLDEAADAIAQIEADYARHSAAAVDVAREYFSHDRVLPNMLAAIGVGAAVGV